MSETKVGCEADDVALRKFLEPAQRLQILYPAVKTAVVGDGACLVEVDVRMVAQPLYATTVQVDEVDGPGVDGKPGLQLGGVQMDFL